MDTRTRIFKVIERWFLMEPALFQVLCSHDLVENGAIRCPVRCGRRRIEYNPDLLSEMSEGGLDEALRTEAVRILLKHPYERRPDQCSDQAIAVGSDITVGDNYEYGQFRIDTPGDYRLERGRSYEWYSRKIQDMLPSSDEGETGEMSTVQQKLGLKRDRDADLSALWEEDELALEMIDGIIDSVKDWGTISGAFVEKLKADSRAKISWKNVLSGFRSSIISSRRRLTRMRPSRRYGCDAMGSTKEFDTRLLVAVDVSGSVSTQSLSYFYGVVNNAFRYGFRSIDVIQFDCGVRIVQSLGKAMKEVAVLGRGGTSFQEPVDYAVENGYDGLLILTDGYARAPVLPHHCRTKLVWVCENRRSYEVHHAWMEKLGRVCTVELT